MTSATTPATPAPHGTASHGTAPSAPDAPRRTPRRRSTRLLPVGALATGLVLLGTGAVAAGQAHKTVTVDIDGVPITVTTFAGSVDGLLEQEGVEVGPRDAVTPAADEVLRDGGEVVVRHAREVVLLADGEKNHVWTTALSADEALQVLASRGDDVALMASRSAGRADLGLQLDLDGPVDVVVDGRTESVVDGAAGLEAVLAELDITLGDLDRVTAEHVDGPDGPRLTVVVQRVVSQEVPTVTEIPFTETVTKTDELYRGETEVQAEGTPGQRTQLHRVILVDGAEESRRLLSDTVTTEPVDRVVLTGTKERPAPEPEPARTSSPTSSSTTPAPRSTVSGDVWAALAQCESGGDPTIVSSNGLYYGLYQFSLSTWRSVGGTGLPSEASPAEQTQRAQILQARSGWGQWPACSTKLGLR